MAPKDVPWFIVEPHVGKAGSWLNFKDSRGNRRDLTTARPEEEAGWTRLDFIPSNIPLTFSNQWSGLFPVYVPDNFWNLLREGTDKLPWRMGPHATGPTPLPVFIDIPMQMPAFPWEAFLSELMSFHGQLDLDRYQFIRLARQRWKRRPPVALPYRILAVGVRNALVFGELQKAYWYEMEEVQKYGLTFTVLDLADDLTAVSTMAPGHHIIICDPDNLAAVLEVTRRSASHRNDTQPRLLIVIDRSFDFRSYLSLAAATPPPGTSLVWLPADPPDPDATHYLKDFLYGLIHDYPVYEAVKSAHRTTAVSLENPVLIISNPVSVQNLRMLDAVSKVVDEAVFLKAQILPGDVEGFLKRAEGFSGELGERLRGIKEKADPQVPALDFLDHIADYQREETGMKPASRGAAGLAKLKEMEPELQELSLALEADPRERETFRQHQQRCVDIKLKRFRPREGETFFVKNHEPVQPQRQYQLMVNIGQRSEHSLVVGEVPPIDPMLPEPDPEKGHRLNVAVFTRDFRISSPTMQELILPPLGASPPVFFKLMVPRAAKPGKKARMRICIYYDLPVDAPATTRQEDYYNYLLQSFILEALVAPTEDQRFPTPVTYVSLEFSRTSRFGNLHEITPRLISLGLNDGPQPGTHQLMIKRGGRKGEVNLPEKVLENALENIRKELEKATRDEKIPRKPRFPEIKRRTPQREADFDLVIRKLARAGYKLYDAIWTRLNQALQDTLWELTENSDRIIQVVRYDPNYLFPWAVLYDFFLPEEVSGAPEPEVCHGFLRTSTAGEPWSCAQCLNDCLHPDKSETFCVYGFWGTRHRVEQVLHTPAQSEDAIRHFSPIRDGALRVALGVTGGLLTDLTSELTTKIGQQWVREMSPEQDIYNMLWNDADRPSILLIVSHYQTKDRPDEPKGPRLKLPGQNFLQPHRITKKLRKERNRKWTDPHTLVLLVACESAADDLATLGSFLTAFADARAAAVVGTENTIFEGLAVEFSKSVTAALFDNVSLGEAILRFRRQLLQELNPLGFIFTPYGDAELVREPTCPSRR